MNLGRIYCAVLVLAVAVASGCGGATTQPGHDPAPFKAQLQAPSGDIAADTVAHWQVTLTNGTAPFNVAWDFGGGAVDAVPAQTGLNTASAAVDSRFRTGQWTATVTVTDALGRTVIATAPYSVILPRDPGDSHPTAAFTPQADTLYATPLQIAAEVDEEVTIEVVTGELPYTLAYVSGVGIVLDGDARYVPNSFNLGEPGGGAYTADGIWAGVVADGSFLPIPDSFIVPAQLTTGSLRFDLNVTPLGSGGTDFAGLDGRSGALFNFKVKFSTPGTKTVRLQPFNLVDRTYYQSAVDPGTIHHWGNTANDGSGGAPNKIVIGGQPHPGDPPADPGTALPDGFSPAADTLYAIPQAASASVGEPVTVAVIAGPASQACRYVYCGVTMEDDAVYVNDSFNAGDLGGLQYDVDGIWSGLLDSADPFIANPTVHDLAGDHMPIGGGRQRMDLGLLPRFLDNAGDIGGRSGVLYNFQVTFSTPGVKTFGFEAFHGVKRTYYMDAANTEYDWSDIANSGAAVRNSITIH